eukprot:gene45824-26762_t
MLGVGRARCRSPILPVVLTVTLALGSAKMADEGAIVTNLSSLQE